MKRINNEKGFSALDIILVIVALAAIGAAVYFAIHNHNAKTAASASPTPVVTTTPSTSPSVSYAILAPATVISKTAECSQQLTVATDGTSGPISCSNGDLNVLEWKAVQNFDNDGLTPSVMTLGYNATNAQVQAAECSDISNKAFGSFPNEEDAYSISALYYGWKFPSHTTAADLSC